MKESRIKRILAELLETSFFSEWRTPSEVLKKLDQRGIKIEGKKKGMICRMLTQMCQNSTTGLERDQIPKDERIGKERYRFKKVS